MAIGLTLKATSGDYVVVDEGIYQAEVTGYTQEEDHPEYGPRIRIQVTIRDGGEFDGREMSGLCSVKFSAKSKLRVWVEAAIGRKVEDGEDFNLDEIIGRPVMMQVVHRKTADRSYDNIGMLFPSKKGSTSSAGKRF